MGWGAAGRFWRNLGLAVVAAVGVRMCAPGVVWGQGPQGGIRQGESGLGTPRGSALGLKEPSGIFESSGGFGGYSGRQEATGGALGTLGFERRPGDPGDVSLGQPIGASGTASFGETPGVQGAPLGGRLGPTGIRIPFGELQPPQNPMSGESGPGRRPRPEEIETDPATLSRAPEFGWTSEPEDPGPADGLTLDRAMELLLARNIDLIALRYEIPKAEADILTASLRKNPVFFADGQLVPYGSFPVDSPWGPTQYDVNITFPLDVSGKRRARIAVARAARKVVEAQFQDAVRSLFDRLNGSFVNALATRESVRFARARLVSLGKELARQEAEYRAGRCSRETVEILRDQWEQSRFDTGQSEQSQAQALRALGLLLNLPEGQAESIRLRGRLRELVELPVPPEALKQTALACRPDLAAYRLGVRRADADTRLAKANRFADVYLVYQPFTYQSHVVNNAQGSTFRGGFSSYALGINAAMPLFNRNQGNVKRSELNARQTRVELSSMERQVIYEVDEAIRELMRSRQAVVELETRVIPRAVRSLDSIYRQYRQDESRIGDYVGRLDNINDVVRQYRNVLVVHRRQMLGLNTAVSARIMP